MVIRAARLLAAFMLLAILAVSSAVAAEPPAGRPFTLMLRWRHQAQFAGYYMAQAKGFYARRGINMEIISGTPRHATADYLCSGKADFAVLDLPTAMKRYASGERLINLAQIIQKNPAVLIARKNSGINRIQDMNGKRLGIWDATLPLQLQLLFRKTGITMKTLPHNYTANLFLRGGIDVSAAMWHNEYHSMINSGLNPEELKLFFLSDYGIRFPDDGLYTRESTYLGNRKISDDVAAASLEGWRYAFEHPEETLNIVLQKMKDARIPASRAHQKWMLERMRELMMPNEAAVAFGELGKADYQFVSESLQSVEGIRNLPIYQDFTGNRHVQK